MSDAAAADKPLDLAQYATPPSVTRPPPFGPAGPATSPPQSQQALVNALGLAGQMTMTMASKGITPESLAQATNIPVDTIYQVMTGRIANMTIASLSLLMEQLGTQIIVQMAPPEIATQPRG